MIIEEKKIGFRYYLNKRLNPVVIAEDNRYQVYVQVTFDRKNTQLPCPFPFSLGGLTEHRFKELFEERIDKEVKEEIEEFEAMIENILRFEFKNLKSNFVLKGLSKRLSSYYDPLGMTLRDSVSSRMKLFFKESEITKSKFRFSQIEAMLSAMDGDFASTYMMLKDIMPDIRDQLPEDLEISITAYLHFLTSRISGRVFDWLDEKIRKRFQEYLFNVPEEEEIFKYEAPGSIFVSVWREFPIRSQYRLSYVAAIDQMILS